jgi:hypothetical protein
MLDTVFGLPVHALMVHAIVVVVPTAAAAVVLSVLWRRFRVWAGPGPMALSVLAVFSHLSRRARAGASSTGCPAPPSSRTTPGSATS